MALCYGLMWRGMPGLYIVYLHCYAQVGILVTVEMQDPTVECLL